MENIKVNTNNGLVVGIDYLSFTVFGDYTVEEIIEFMGFTPNLFCNMPNGSHGYKRMTKYENISILYDGASHMGTHVEITGSSIATLLNVYKEKFLVSTPFGAGYDFWAESTLSHFVTEVMKIGHFTRIDIAIDDFDSKYYSLDDIVKRVKKDLIVSKWRTCRNLEGLHLKSCNKVGHTIYFGSPQSEIMLRIYDKKLEHNLNLSMDDDNYISFEWVRWELQLRKERADMVAQYLAKNMLLGEVAIGILSNYFRIVKLDDCNRSRCSSEPKWNKFVNDVSRLRITVKKNPKTLEETLNWFERQNGRTVAKLFYYVGGDSSYFADLACRYECRLTQQDKVQLGLV